MEKKTVRVGLVGSGYGATLHCNAYAKVCGTDVVLRTVADIDAARALEMRDAFGFEGMTTDYRDMLVDPDIDVIDIATPPVLHVRMIEEALKAGKHVICEKPLSGYFGREGDPQPIGTEVSKKKMYDDVIGELDALRLVVEGSGRQFCYAENFVYAPPIQKAAEIIRAKKSKVLFMKGEESLKGSSSAVAGSWAATGGGTFIRTGTHPLTGILWLKRQESIARGEEISVLKVSADTGVTTSGLTEREHRHIAARPQDVEDFGIATLTFSDGTKAVVMASDAVLGGTKNYIEVYANDAALVCNLTPNDMMSSYLLDEEGMDDVVISEMLPSKLGWNKAFVSDEVVRGYTGELEDFMDAVANDRPAESGFDLAYDTAKVLYAAYLAAEEERAVYLK